MDVFERLLKHSGGMVECLCEDHPTEEDKLLSGINSVCLVSVKLGKEPNFVGVIIPWLLFCGCLLEEIQDDFFFYTETKWLDAGPKRSFLFATMLCMSFWGYFVSLFVVT